MKFIWTEEYSVNVKLIDKQHQHFFEIANKVYDLVVKTSFDRGEIFNVVIELEQYAIYHLETEEEFFKQINYADAEFHIGEHNKFRKEIKKYLEDIKDENMDMEAIAKSLADFSSDWLINHIPSVDKKYTKAFNEHGIV